MAVYDCCTFFNENDVFEIRLNTHWDMVDKFVVIEAGETHTGLKKPYNFDLDRFAPYMSKIHYVTFDNFEEEMSKYPELDCPLGRKFHNNKYNLLEDWARDHFQGNYLYKILQDIGANDDDIVYISPADELFRKKAFSEAVKRFSTKELFQVRQLGTDAIIAPELLRPIFGFKQYVCIWKFNLFRSDDTVGGLVTQFSNFHKYLPATMRSASMSTHSAIERGGWHFSYADPTDGDSVIAKYKSWAHARDPYGVNGFSELRFDVKSKEQALEMLFTDHKVKIVSITSETHPPYMVDNIEKFKYYMFTGDEQVLKGREVIKKSRRNK